MDLSRPDAANAAQLNRILWAPMRRETCRCRCTSRARHTVEVGSSSLHFPISSNGSRKRSDILLGQVIRRRQPQLVGIRPRIGFSFLSTPLLQIHPRSGGTFTVAIPAAHGSVC